MALPLDPSGSQPVGSALVRVQGLPEAHPYWLGLTLTLTLRVNPGAGDFYYYYYYYYYRHLQARVFLCLTPALRAPQKRDPLAARVAVNPSSAVTM